MFINHKDLPIEVVIKRAKINKDHFLAKSRLEFVVDETEVTLVGSSYGRDKNLCIEKSKSEIIERFFSHKLIATDKLFQSRSLIPSEFYQSKSFKQNQVTLGNGVDATGLSFNIKKYAELHAVSEVIERHWLASIWYKNVALNLLECHKHQGHELIILCLLYFDIPLIIAVICDDTRGLLFCGSALKSDFNESKIHSINEAYMLYEGYILKELSTNNNYLTRSQERISSLNRGMFNKQISHFYSLIKSKNSQRTFQKSYNISSIIEISNLKIADFYFIDFYQSGNKGVVRALNLNALSPKKLRGKQKEIIEDPFY